MKPSEFAALLKGKKTGEGQWLKVCPAHDDRRASLRISTGRDGRILINCYAGCDARDVVGSLGLTIGDLFPEPLEPSTRRRHRPREPRPRRFIDRSTLADDELEVLDKLEAIARRIRWHERMQRLADQVGWWMVTEWKGPRGACESYQRWREQELLGHLSPEQRYKLDSWIDELTRSEACG